MVGESLGSYRIVSKIGQGGMGVVYRAHDDVLNRDVALKVLSEGAAENESSRDHVLHEARASSALSHPNAGRDWWRFLFLSHHQRGAAGRYERERSSGHDCG